MHITERFVILRQTICSTLVLQCLGESYVQGFGTALMANTQLLGYFVDKGEGSAAMIQGIGVLSNYTVMAQVGACNHCCHWFWCMYM
jgi:hypothetical protein